MTHAVKRRPLKLRRETLVILHAAELRHAVGGASGQPCHNGGAQPPPDRDAP